jgi:hypothetical protein
VNHFAVLPTIFTILGKLGLELKRQEDILPVYPVERIERPAANLRSRFYYAGLRQMCRGQALNSLKRRLN